MTYSLEDLPDWVWVLVAAVDRYESEHGSAKEGWPCFYSALVAVPKDVLVCSRVVAAREQREAS